MEARERSRDVGQGRSHDEVRLLPSAGPGNVGSSTRICFVIPCDIQTAGMFEPKAWMVQVRKF
jgi:hypothetical protein